MRPLSKAGKSLVNNLLSLVGLRVVRVQDSVPSVPRLLRELQITTVIDVGANEGQYALGLRHNKFGGKIISFEPQNSAFEALCKNSARDQKWRAVKLALGDAEKVCKLNISKNSLSSSFLTATPEMLRHESGIERVNTELVAVSTLDLFFKNDALQDEAIFLKIDAQGYENAVLRGAESILSRCKGVQIEMALVRSYEGQDLIGDTLQAMYAAGFRLVLVFPAFVDRNSGYLYEVDGIFLPAASANSLENMQSPTGKIG